MILISFLLLHVDIDECSLSNYTCSFITECRNTIGSYTCPRKSYHYTNLTFVCESGRSREAIRPELKRFPTLHRWTWMLHEAAH